MFERNKIDNRSDTSHSAPTVEILMEDGTVLIGRVHHAATRGLGDELNGASQFIDFEPVGKPRIWLKKAAVRTVVQQHVPRADQLERAKGDPAALHPHRTLGVSEDADNETIRTAYHQLVRTYHPDRFANMDLPIEVRDYLNAMARRVNLAYAALSASKSGNSQAA